MSTSLTTGTATAKRTLASLRSKIFQHAPPAPLSSPGGVRTGSKILKAPLRGPAMLQYYNPKLNLRSVRELDFGNEPMYADHDIFAEDREDFEEGDEPIPQKPGVNGGAFTFAEIGEDQKGVDIVEVREIERLMDVDARKARGKGPPKKGGGRRAGLKGKKK